MASRSAPRARRRPLEVRSHQPCQALALAPQKRPKTQPVVELRQRGQVRRLALQRLRPDAQAHVAGDGRQLAREIHRLAMLTQTLRSEEHTSELQSHLNLVCRLLLEKKK